jgi:hypothetical protein
VSKLENILPYQRDFRLTVWLILDNLFTIIYTKARKFESTKKNYLTVFRVLRGLWKYVNIFVSFVF